MSDFKCPVVEVTIEDHPNADRLEVATHAGFKCIVPKGQMETGDWAVYIPEGSIVPDDLLDDMGLTGKLAGADKNRVKAVRLRGVLSQGLLIPIDDIDDKSGIVKLGDDLAGHLGVTKWEPPIPTALQGQTYVAPVQPYQEINNVKHGDVEFEEGEEVSVTPKIHGTCSIFTWHNGELHATSKGIAKRGLALTEEQQDGYRNVYLRIANELDLNHLLACVAQDANARTVTLYGEIYGKGIQDMHYGADQPTFIAFDMKIDGEWLTPAQFMAKADFYGIARVPEIYVGEFDPEAIEMIANSHELARFGGGLREGVVVKSADDSHKVVKVINPDYLTRKGGTEYE